MSENTLNCYHLFGSETLLEKKEPVDSDLIRSSVRKGYVVPRGKPEALMYYVERFQLEEIYDPIVDEHHEVQKLIIKRLDLIDQQEILIEKKKLYCKKSSFEMLLELGDLIAQDFNFQEIKFKEQVGKVDNEIIRCRVRLDTDSRKKTRFKRYSVKDMLSLPPTDWIIEGLFSRGAIGMIYGPPGCGKSFLMSDLMLKSCLGGTWAFRHEIKKALNVAYCTKEAFNSWGDRLKAALIKNNVEDLLNLHFFNSVPQLFNQESTENVFEFINQWKFALAKGEQKPLDLLIIDTLHSACEGGDENDASDMREVLNSCHIIEQMLGCAIILVHHCGKTGVTSRGSNALECGSDFVLKVVPSKEIKNESKLSYEKLKDVEKPDPIDFCIIKVEGSNSAYPIWNDFEKKDLQVIDERQELKDEILGLLIENKPHSCTAKKMRSLVEKPQQIVSEILKELLDEGKCFKKIEKTSKSKGFETPEYYYSEHEI